MLTHKLQLPNKFSFLFEPHRFKIAYGGRGSAKSWSFAIASLIQARMQKKLILCARETQKSINESVYRLLVDSINWMQATDELEILKTTIKHKITGSEFIFAGIKEHTVDSLKSYEGVDICWIEEGQAVSDESITKLFPTIRKKGSEIWVTYNPDLETDPIHQYFVINPPDDCVAVQVNYFDNPWFSEELDKQRAHDQKRMPLSQYECVWLGKCMPAVTGAIYFNEVAKAELDGRLASCPYDPNLKVHVVIDLGWNDAMSILMVQKHHSEIRIIDYIEDSHRTLEEYSNQLKNLGYNFGRMWLPHDGYSKDFKTANSAAEIMGKLGWDVPDRKELVELSVEEGIRNVRMGFSRLIFNKDKTERLIECLRRYRRVITRNGEAGSPLHDQYSHGADGIRYLINNEQNMTNSNLFKSTKIEYKKLGLA